MVFMMEDQFKKADCERLEFLKTDYIKQPTRDRPTTADRRSKAENEFTAFKESNKDLLIPIPL